MQTLQIPRQKIKEFVILPYGQIISGGSDRYDYEGKETDSTDLQYFGARYYDSYTRVFTQPDSIIPDVYDPQQLNPYMFERGNPFSYVDESGHQIRNFLAASPGASTTFAVSFLKGIRNQININTLNLVQQLGVKAYDILVKPQIDVLYWSYEEEDNVLLKSYPGYTAPTQTEMTKIREEAVYGGVSMGLSLGGGIGNAVVKTISYFDVGFSLVTNKGLAEQMYEGYKGFSEPQPTQQGREPSFLDKVINFFGELFE